MIFFPGLVPTASTFCNAFEIVRGMIFASRHAWYTVANMCRIAKSFRAVLCRLSNRHFTKLCQIVKSTQNLLSRALLSCLLATGSPGNTNKARFLCCARHLNICMPLTHAQHAAACRCTYACASPGYACSQWCCCMLMIDATGPLTHHIPVSR